LHINLPDMSLIAFSSFVYMIPSFQLKFYFDLRSFAYYFTAHYFD
jgi:hypothetical protein